MATMVDPTFGPIAPRGGTFPVNGGSVTPFSLLDPLINAQTTQPGMADPTLTQNVGALPGGVPTDLYGATQPEIWEGAPGTLHRGAPPTTGGGFDIPTNVFPFSTSYSGLPGGARTGFLNALMPQLTKSITDMPSNIDKYTQEALNAYKQQMGTAMTGAMPGLLNQLAGRNVLSSTVASDAIGNVMRDIIGGYGEKGYLTGMEGARMKAGMPQMLGNLAQLGQFSGGFQADPLAPYNTMANLIRGLM